MSASTASVHARTATTAPIPATAEATDATELADTGTTTHSASASSQHEETEASNGGGNGASHDESSESSASSDGHESHTPEPATETTAPEPVTTTATATPKPAENVTSISSSTSGGGSSTTVGIALALTGVLLILGVVLVVRRRRRNRRLLHDKFNPSLTAPRVSVELPPPPPSSSRRSGSQLTQSRLSVFSGNRSNSDSLFNTAAPIVSPHGRIHQNGRVTVGSNHSGPFHPDQSMTYHLVDPSPSHIPSDIAPSPAHSSSANSSTTFALTAASVGQGASPAQRLYQPDYGISSHLPRKTSTTRKISVATTVTSSTASFSSESSSVVSLDDLAMSSRTSDTSTVVGLHDSMCDDFYHYGDGIGRERAISRGRGASAASASNRGPSTVLEIDELEPAPAAVLSKTPSSSKTISFTAMQGKKRAPPPPPPAVPLPEVEPFNPLFMTSVKAHRLRASENDSGDVVVASAFADSSSNAPFGGESHLQSSHSGRAVEKPTDAAIQRLSDVSSVYSDSSSVRAGSLIELKQVPEVEHVDGTAKEIEI